MADHQGRMLFDAEYYSAAADMAFSDDEEAWLHFCAHGEQNNLPPAKHFLPKWYRWQNPDHEVYPTILDHFATAGAARLIDPSPFVDLTQLARKTGARTAVEAYEMLASNALTSHDGFFSGYDALSINQQAFLEAISTDLLFDKRDQTQSKRRKRLVWIQIGAGSDFTGWFDKRADRSWDLVTNWYRFDGVDLSLGEFAYAQRGTKFTGLARAMALFPDHFEGYDQILLLDDDLSFDFKGIDRLFDIAERDELALFQAGLSPKSHCIWPALKDKRASGTRDFNTVEIMMPGFDMSFLRSILPLFERTISGFGLDLAYGELAKKAGLKCGVVFDVRAHHLKPIDTNEGAYYDYMRSSGINPKLELWQLIEEYQPDLDIKAI